MSLSTIFFSCMIFYIKKCREFFSSKLQLLKKHTFGFLQITEIDWLVHQKTKCEKMVGYLVQETFHHKCENPKKIKDI